MSVSTLFAPLPLVPGPSSHYQPMVAPLATNIYSLEDLVKDIKSYLGTSSGIGCDNIDSEYLISLVERYKSNPNDWARYYYNCPGKNYTRNAIENINHKANILLLVWNPGKGSPIHDHANAHCIMKVLAGELTETVYHPPITQGDDASPLELKSQNTLQVDGITYITDDIGLHRVYNPNPNQVAVSLHLYTPPNAADIGYNVFDRVTGKASFVPQAQTHEAKK